MENELMKTIEEMKERISKNNNDILNLTVKYNQLLSLFLSVVSASEKINGKIDDILKRVYAINDSSISTTSSVLTS